MKTLLTFAALVSMNSAFAQNITVLKAGDLSLSKANGTITSVMEICPQVPGRPSCMAYGSVIEINVKLNGCLDRVGGYSSKFEIVDGKGVLYFSAINIATKASTTARCIVQASQNVTVGVPFEGEIELVNMDFTGVEAQR